MDKLSINGVPAAKFIKEAYRFDSDEYPFGCYDHSDPVQVQLRHIKGWIQMAEHDALEARNV